MASKHRPFNKRTFSADVVHVDPSVPSWNEMVTAYCEAHKQGNPPDPKVKLWHEEDNLPNQSGFSKYCDLETTMVNRWSNRGSVPSPEVVRKVAEAIGIDEAVATASRNKTQALWQQRNAGGSVLLNTNRIIDLEDALRDLKETVEADSASLGELQAELGALRERFDKLEATVSKLS